jgi:sigma-B regulation protein RsbU (phosphoserine phosphatase)
MLEQPVTSFLWARLAVSLFLLVTSQFARVVTRRRDVAPLVSAAYVLVIRDAVAILMGSRIPGFLPYLRVVGEAGAYLFLLLWSGRFRASNRSLWAASALVGGAVVATVLDIVFADGPGLLSRVSLYLVPPALFGITFVAITRVDRFVFSRGYEIEDLKPWLQVVLAVQGLFYLVVPMSAPVFEYLVAILPATPLLVTALFVVSLSLNEERARTRTLRESGQSIFTFLSDVGRPVAGGRDPETILRAAIETISRAVVADGAVAIIVESGAPRVSEVIGLFPPPVPVPDIVKHKQGALRQFVMTLEIGSNTPVWGRVLAHGEAIHVAEAEDDPYLAAHAHDRVLRLRSTVVLPLKIRGKILGAVSLVRRGDSRPFSQAEFDHARTMANFVAVTMDNYQNYRLQRDVEIAGDIQRRLQAAPAGDLGGISYAGISRPARGVSGDYYDVISVDPNRTVLVICDVSGKGVPAALVMVMVRTIVHLAVAQSDDAGQILEMINVGVSGAISLDRFATASVVVFDARRNSFSYANAAHHPALLISSTDGAVDHIDADGLPIGIEESADYPSREVPFPPGSTLLFYTDGVVEAINAEGITFGDEHLEEVVRDTLLAGEARGEEPAAILQRVLAQLDLFVGGAPQHDDITMLLCRSLSAGVPGETGSDLPAPGGI